MTAAPHDRDPTGSPQSAAAVGAETPRLGDRGLFPTLTHLAYLSHSAIAPLSTPALESMRAVLDDYAREGLHALFPQLERREVLRASLARLIGARTEDIGLTTNTGHGITAIATCLPWRPGDRVVLFRGEFPANVTPWQRAAELFDLRLEMLPLAPFEEAHAAGLGRLEAALRAAPTRLVAVSSVQFQTGLRMPIAEIGRLCREHGAELFVDGIQSLGVVPLDVRAAGVDYLSAGGHKWLMGPEGTGFLYVAPHRVADLVPRTASWLSHEDPISFLLEGAGKLRYDRPIRARADFVEGGAANTIGLAGLHAAIDLIAALGVGAIFEHTQRYLDALEAGLVARGFQSLRSRDPAGRSAILSVTLEDRPGRPDTLALQHGLVERGVSCTAPDGNLRFAPHWPNGLDEPPRVLAVIDELLAAGQP